MKKGKPSFDVARAEIGGQGARWVYRSDVPSRAASTWGEGPVESAAPQSKSPVQGAARQVTSVAVAPAADSTVDIPAATDARPRASRAKSRYGWLDMGVSIVTMPMTLAIIAMIGPVVWFAGSRPRR